MKIHICFVNAVICMIDLIDEQFIFAKDSYFYLIIFNQNRPFNENDTLPVCVLSLIKATI